MPRLDPIVPAAPAGRPDPALTRRGLVALSAAAAATLGLDRAAAQGIPPVPPGAELALGGDAKPAGGCATVSDTPTAERPPPQEAWRDFSASEVELAFRCHGMQAEFLREPITPLGAHFLLIHFDVPRLDAQGYSVTLAGHVRRPRRVTLDELRRRHVLTQAVTMECAGTGRSTMRPRSIYVPWFREAVGTYRWTGTPLRPLLEQAGLLDGAREVLFTGWDTGVDLGVEHAFERSLPLEEALRDEVMLAWEANGQPLLPQHGFPLRLVVPSWYGMASVKWLRAITVLDRPFEGIEQARVYRYQQGADDPGEPVRQKRVNSAILPPGIPDLVTRRRFLAPGRHTVQGMAWSGAGRITHVDVSTDGGANWREARLASVAHGQFAWMQWSAEWDVGASGDYVLACRARDEAGNVQSLDAQDTWNRQGMGGNAVQRIPITVQDGVGVAATQVPSPTRAAVPGARLPPAPNAANLVLR